ncbi:hypothetical protein [Shewanella maritima]|uniref:hypothetical protein n=1 Tax=Shewanella maritima TaxID=2520507 RepID=UPI0013EE6C85|nr:hypothetical protein [Shewanella maritima]
MGSAYSQAVAAGVNSRFTILVGIGGGGDSHTSAGLISALAEQAKQNNWLIKPIIGPLTDNKQQLLSLFEQDDWVEPITDCYDLYPHIAACDLYIGAAGGVLYQLLALKKPAVTFSLSANQQTDISALEGIGHYFHCDTDMELAQLAKLVQTIEANYDRVTALLDINTIAIDGMGASRVAEVMTHGCSKPLETYTKPYSQQHQYERLNDNYRVRAVVDSDINHYLDSRNLAANAKNMIATTAIPRLGHYHWWFTSSRDSFALEHNEQISLYIWHQVYQLDAGHLAHLLQRQFLIGGWFVTEQSTSFQDAMLALNWQLEHCDKHHPDTPWIAVIHKKNNYVKLMNDYLGFEDVPLTHEYHDVIGTFFAGASSDDFHYVMRQPQSRRQD